MTTTPLPAASPGLLEAVLAASADVIVVIDEHGVVGYASDAAERVLGRPIEEWIGRSVIELVHPDDRAAVVDSLTGSPTEAGPSPASVVFRASHAAGHWITLEASGLDRIDEGGVSGIVAVIRDISARVDAEQRLRRAKQKLDFAESHDALTGLPNRVALERELHALARRVGESGRPAHLLMAKVADPDELRARYGNDESDHILRALGWAVRGEVQPEDNVATVGAGEFVVLVAPGRSASDVDDLARRLLGLAVDPLSRRATGVDLTLAVGVSTLRARQSATAALDQVGRAARWGVVEGSTQPVVFDEQLLRDEGDRRRLTLDIERALAAGEFELHYQPIRDMRSGRITSFEGQVRWNHPDEGVVEAGRFLPAIEGSALVVSLGEQAMSSACAQLARWQRRFGLDAPTVCLDVSPRQIRAGYFAAMVGERLETFGAAGSGLCLEVTETRAFDDPVAARDELRLVREMGVSVGLDHFGCGYSALHHLRELPADVVKIGAALVAGLGEDDRSTAIVRAMIELGVAFGTEVVAEGVTTIEQHRRLFELGCDRVQGALVAPALPAHLAERLIVGPGVEGTRAGAVDAEISRLVERVGNRLRMLDADYRPSGEEIAALCGLTAGQTRRALNLPGGG